MIVKSRSLGSPAVASTTGVKTAVCLSRNSVLHAFLAGTRESTAPTVVVSSTAVESNTVDLNSTCNGTAVIVDYYPTR